MRAMEAFTAAGMVVVNLDGQQVLLGDVTPQQLELIRCSKSRGESMQVARKYLRASEAVRDLHMSVQNLGQNADLLRHAKRSTVTQAAPAAAPPAPAPPQLAIVPFVQPAPVNTPVTDEDDDEEVAFWKRLTGRVETIMTSYGQSLVWKLYKKLMSLTFYAVLYLPLMFMWLFLLYGFFLAVHVANHPDLLIVLGFKMLRMVPDYTAWAGEQMFARLASELEGWWR